MLAARGGETGIQGGIPTTTPCTIIKVGWEDVSKVIES